MNNRRDPAGALGGEGRTGEFGVEGSSHHLETFRKRKIRVLAHLENLVLLGLLVTFGSGTPALWAQGPSNRDLYSVTAVQVKTGPRIDGLLDDEVWRSAALIDQFTQQEPDEGSPATEVTEVLILYDARNLYIGVRAFDSKSDDIVASEMRHDSARILEEDNFQIIIDTFNDYRSGYMFVTNPLGARLEQQVSEEGEGFARGNASSINRDWDGVWEAASRRSEQGWTAEIVIPTTTIRFQQGEMQTWGINFMRNIRRKNEQVFWAPIPKGYSLTRVSLAGTLTGLRSLNQGVDLKIKPFLLGGVRTERLGPNTDTSVLSEVGLDMKYGLTSALNLDITVNTDFAQVEVDQQQVNLTRFSLFFPEKRDFFLENAGQFNLGTRRREAELFFSRRIGLSETGQPIPILGGVRLTGKVNRHNIAVLDIQTQDAFGRNGENFLVGRYSRDIFSRSKIGGLFINKQEVDGGDFNRTMALDTTLALSANLTVNGFLAKTSTPGISDGDLAFHGRAAFRNPSWNLYAQYLDIQDDFNAEVGFVPRRGIRTTRAHVEYNPRPESFHIRVMEPMINVTLTTDQNNQLVTRRIHHMVGIRLQNGSFINFIYNRRFERLDQPFEISPGVIIPFGSYNFGEWFFTFNSDPSRRLYERFTYSPQTFFDGFRRNINATVGFRATHQLSTEVSLRRSDVDLPGGDFVVNLSSLQVDYSFSPRMTLRSLFQYDSSTRELSSSIRYHFIYRPGSDLYLVYNDLRTDMPGADLVRDRQLVVKLNYLLSR
ncbi:MAG: DUF5916 domain-containing protein [Acidobacteria bacterium]|nr:DUF5916 domain-containing protein [Acidobacteriota bacterium]